MKFVSEAVLEQNPKFRAIHSGASVQKIIEKVQSTVCILGVRAKIPSSVMKGFVVIISLR